MTWLRRFLETSSSLIWLALVGVLTAVPLATRFGSEIWFGMLAPLAVTSTSWIVAERSYRRSPGQLTSVMMAAFAAKVVFFGAYVSLAIGVLDVQPVPFVVSFAGYYIVLHMLEALWLKRLFAS
jgi:hypothetical protein